MKVIGLLGGMSWESTAEYYRYVNERVRDRLGGLHSAHCVLYSVDFAEIERLQVTGQWAEAGRLLDEAAEALRRAGADFLVLCTNTMHKVADQLTALPLLHLGDATAAAVRNAGLTRVGLLGTAFTMEQDFYRDRLAAHGLDVLTPDADDRAEVHRIIYEELVVGVVRGGVPPGLPGRHRQARRPWRRGRDPRLHRDRTARRRRRQPGPGLPDHPSARGVGGRPRHGTRGHLRVEPDAVTGPST